MAMAKNTKTALTLGAAAAGLLLLTAALKPKKKHKSVVRPGETTDRYMGEQFVLRLPRGEYDMLGGDGLTMVTASDIGNSTDIVIAVGSAANDFIVQPRFSNIDDPTEQYDITVRVKALPLPPRPEGA
jgi:hypothetical protein